MTTTRELCRVLATALHVPGIERYAARLVRDGLLPCSSEEVDERDAAMLLLAVAATPYPAQATQVVEILASLNLGYLVRKLTAFALLQCDDDDRALMPGNVVDAVAEALEFETFNGVPGFQITRLSVEQGGQGVALDARMYLPEETRRYSAQYGEPDLLPSGIQFSAVVLPSALSAVARAFQPQTGRQAHEPMLSLVTH